MLNSAGAGNDANCAKGIIYAVNNGARVINMSFGGAGYSQTLKDACDSAFGKGCLLVAAAGNDTPQTPIPFTYYPAAYDSVLSVGATDNGDKRATFSN